MIVHCTVAVKVQLYARFVDSDDFEYMLSLQLELDPYDALSNNLLLQSSR